VSKSSFFSLFLLSVASLATAAVLRPGGAWLGDIRSDVQYEARAEVASLKDDAHDIRALAESAPNQLKAIWNDASRDFRILKADLTIEARLAARRISTLIKTT
jgi:hypothetical protein